ncbi:hypothetical protein [Hymenobacter sp. CRA2]|uniref:hypothetical protein n=1 Tax=Hymenobacter sp. CRA2 TaxID=1955620 RepID=UPI00098EF022|nr:hypothetical protein [Hymenobacter sp. CRA2]OON69776.1 hypothetical protein B0919_07570 [Hymenobacter sp. CRA2]
MSYSRTFRAETEAELWPQLHADLTTTDLVDYQADLDQGPYQLQLELQVDAAAGTYSYLKLAARVPGRPLLRFALHEQTWLQEIGKLLGMEDVELGFPELDAAFIISTNDTATLKDLLADSAVQELLLRHRALRLVLTPASLAAGADVLLTATHTQGPLAIEQVQEIYHLLSTLVQRIAARRASSVLLA